jgi:hypothetical protein
VVKQVEYCGHLISIAVLPDQGRWAYRVESGPVRMVHEVRPASDAEALFLEAELRAQVEVQCIEDRFATVRATARRNG